MYLKLFATTFAAMFVAGIPLWIRAIRRMSRNRSILGQRERLESPFGLTDVGIMFACWFISQAVAVAVAEPLFGFEPPSNVEELPSTGFIAVMGGSQLIWTFVGLIIIATKYGHAPRIFGWQPEFVGRDLLISVAGFVMVVPMILILQSFLARLVPYEHQTLKLLQGADALKIALLWMSAVIVAPVSEELFFRGVLQGWLQRFPVFDPDQLPLSFVGGWRSPQEERQQTEPYQPRTTFLTQPRAAAPIVISSTLFAAAHLGQGIAFIPLFFFGIALGYVFRQTGSILPCIAIHMMLNGFSMFWTTLGTN